MERSKAAPNVKIALGIHPQIIGTQNADLELFKRLLPRAAFIGEVGLDASPQYFRSLEDQERVFSAIIGLAISVGGRPMSVHGIRAFKRVIQVIRKHDPSLVNQYALHWFSGTLAEAQSALEVDCYFSVNEAMLASSRVRQIVQVLPSRLVLTETDGPFIKRGSIALRPPLVLDVVRDLAAIWKIPVLKAADVIEGNFHRFASRNDSSLTVT